MSESIEKNNPRNRPDGFDHLVYLRLFEGCNLYCKHCFIPHNPKKMSIDQFYNLPQELSHIIGKNKKVLFQWHGGEPTALGVEYIKKCINALEAHAKEYGIEAIHSIQTNLMNYNNQWRDLFKEYFDSSIGISWDYKIRLTNSKYEESNKEYEETFQKNLRKLISDGIKPYLVVTGTKAFFERFIYPSDFFDMIESWGVTHAHIERLTKTGYARDNWDELGLDNLEYSKYMRRFARVYHQVKKDRHRDIHMSPFDGLFESMDRLNRGESGGYGCLSGKCDSTFHTFDANGYKPGCTAINSEYDNKKSTGVNVIEFHDLKNARKKRTLSCEGCQFKPICSSGCLATDKFDESGECSGSYKLFESIKNLA